jgi:kinesin family protein 3/17
MCEDGEVENVRVVVRVRPLSEKEIEAGYQQITKVDTVNKTITVENPQAADGEPPKTFTFDVVFDTDSRQVSYGCCFTWLVYITLIHGNLEHSVCPLQIYQNSYM